MTIVKIINRGYTNGNKEPIFWFTCRDIDRNWYLIKVLGLEPHFYVLERDADVLEAHPLITRIEPCSIPTHRYKKVVNCFTVFPTDVGSVRREIREYDISTWQADIKFELVVSLDLGLESACDIPLDKEYLVPSDIKLIKDVPKVPRRTCYLDIETGEWDDEQRKKGTIPITCMGMLDSYTNVFRKYVWHPKVKKFNSQKFWYDSIIKEKYRKKMKDYPAKFRVERFVYPDNKEMVKSALNWFGSMHFDDVIGWNSSGGIPMSVKIRKKKNLGKMFQEGFDIQYIFAVCRHLKIDSGILSPLGQVYRRRTGEIVIGGIVLFDLMHASEYSMKLVKKKIKKPKNMKLTTISKFFFNVGKLRHKGSVWKFHLENPKEADRYNTIDVELTYAIDRYLRIKDDYEVDAEIATRNLDETLYASKTQDMLTLKAARGRFILPTKEWKKRKS